MLTKGIAAGRYDITDPDQLVERLNADLHTVTPDKHLGLMYNPETSKELAAHPDTGADDAPPTPEDIAAAVRRNSGLVQMRILPGNIRYLETDGFVWAGEVTERAYDDAMRFLSGGDAVIIDMRKNGGGDPFAVRYLVSHFLAPNTKLMTFYMGSNRVDTTAALATTIAPRMVGKPLYVLTSGGTASAAEEFLGHVAGYKLGELIGENSAGAGFRNQFYPLPDGMMISISVGQAILASTGKGWEGVGFAPNTAVPVDQALDVAEAHALKRIASTALAGQAPRARSPGRDAFGQDDAGQNGAGASGLCRRLRRTDRAGGWRHADHRTNGRRHEQARCDRRKSVRLRKRSRSDRHIRCVWRPRDSAAPDSLRRLDRDGTRTQ